MNKSSASNNAGDKTVQHEISHGGYVTSDEKVALPNYLVHVPSQNDVIIEIYLYEELNVRVNCGNLDDDGDYVRYFEDMMR